MKIFALLIVLNGLVCNCFCLGYNKIIKPNVKLSSLKSKVSPNFRHKTSLNLIFDVDCIKYPDVAKFIFGADSPSYCSVPHVDVTSSFNLMSDLSFFTLLLILNFVLNRLPQVNDWDAEDDNDSDDNNEFNSDEVDSIKIQKQKETNSFNNEYIKFPQCRSTGLFQGRTCDLCNGNGRIVIDDDSAQFYLPKSSSSNPSQNIYSIDDIDLDSDQI